MVEINEDVPLDGERGKPGMDVTRTKRRGRGYYIGMRGRGEVESGDAGQGNGSGIFTGR